MKKHAKILEIDTIEKNDVLFIDHCKASYMKEPVKAQISFEKYDDQDSFWVVKNEELGAVRVEKTVEKAKKKFEEDLYEFYQFYKTIPDNELIGRTKKIKEKLIKIFELET
jgi:hypothetical protein